MEMYGCVGTLVLLSENSPGIKTLELENRRDVDPKMKMNLRGDSRDSRALQYM